jgi:hypothetical protein
MALFNGVTDAYFEYLMCQELQLLKQEEQQLDQLYED